jgi:orotate phosphoribosyltransferase
MSRDRTTILAALADECLQVGQFRLASGGTSTIYLDCSRLLRSHYLGPLGRVLADQIECLPGDIDVLAGPGMGAAPLVSVALLELQRRTLGLDVQPTAGLLIRPADPTHGRQNRFDGPLLPQKRQRVLLLDDVLTSGGTLLEAATLIRQAGHDVVGAVVLVDRSGQLPDNVIAVDLDFPHWAIFAIEDILEHDQRGED